jgi:hypothetical protein
MELFNIEVKHDGTRIVATLRLSPDAQHCDLVPGGRPIVRWLGVADRPCLADTAVSATWAVDAVLARLQQRVDRWTADKCGCPVHVEVQVEPLFDLVRGSSEG